MNEQQMLPNDFAIFILTHGRPGKVITDKLLRRLGYTGKLFYILDDLDQSADKYKELYGTDKIIIFNKQSWIDQTDTVDNFKDHRSVLFARNAAYQIARDLNLKYFLVLDDDYSSFSYRFDNKNNYTYTTIKRYIDQVLLSLLDFYKSTKQIRVLAVLQNGDFIGGEGSHFAGEPSLFRKSMNWFICSVDREYNFLGRLNDDVNTYLKYGQTGGLVFSLNQICLKQAITQANTGGLTEIYLSLGTYVKSFYSIVIAPSAVKIGILRGTTHSRIHHTIKWVHVTPQIVRQSLKKSTVTADKQF